MNTKKEQIAKFTANFHNAELTGEKAGTLRNYFRLCEELKELKAEVDACKPKAVAILKEHGMDTHNPKLKEGNTQLGVAVRMDNEIVFITLTTAVGAKVVNWQKLTEHLAKQLGIDDVRELARQLGCIDQRSDTTTLAINESAKARKATE